MCAEECAELQQRSLFGSLQRDAEQRAAGIEPVSSQRLVRPGSFANVCQILVKQSGASAGGAAFILASAVK